MCPFAPREQPTSPKVCVLRDELTSFVKTATVKKSNAFEAFGVERHPGPACAALAQAERRRHKVDQAYELALAPPSVIIDRGLFSCAPRDVPAPGVGGSSVPAPRRGQRPRARRPSSPGGHPRTSVRAAHRTRPTACCPVYQTGAHRTVPELDLPWKGPDQGRGGLMAPTPGGNCSEPLGRLTVADDTPRGRSLSVRTISGNAEMLKRLTSAAKPVSEVRTRQASRCANSAEQFVHHFLRWPRRVRSRT